MKGWKGNGLFNKFEAECIYFCPRLYISGTIPFPNTGFVHETANNKIQRKSMNNFFKKFRKRYFWLISRIFGAKKVFPTNWIVMRVSGTMPKFREI